MSPPETACRLVTLFVCTGGSRMANEEHLAILKEGVDAWNRWTRGQRNILPNLMAADLRDKDLRRADLVAANLNCAVLCEANLGSADLLVNGDLKPPVFGEEARQTTREVIAER